MKKRVGIIFCVVLLLFFIIKIREVLILNKIFSSLSEFKNANNKYYLVNTYYENGINSLAKYYYKDNIEKIIVNNNTVGEYCEVKNLLTDEEVIYNVGRKIKYEKQQGLNFQDNLLNIPNIINIDNKDKKNITIKKVFKIHYIIPISYENKKCYKIVTNSEIVIIDKSTYLPVYASLKSAKTNSEKTKVEYKYEFKIGTVTDDDVALPDFSDYKIE